MIKIVDMVLAFTAGVMVEFMRVNFILINDKVVGMSEDIRITFFPPHHDSHPSLLFPYFREYRWPNNAVYRGEFVSGHRQGEGTYSFADGSTYTGEWHKGRYHGVGQCMWSDGRVYRGEWRNGKAHGFGIEKRADGTIRHEGTWDSDVPTRK
jgi:hypothetical protein